MITPSRPAYSSQPACASNIGVQGQGRRIISLVRGFSGCSGPPMGWPPKWWKSSLRCSSSERIGVPVCIFWDAQSGIQQLVTMSMEGGRCSSRSFLLHHVSSGRSTKEPHTEFKSYLIHNAHCIVDCCLSLSLRLNYMQECSDNMEYVHACHIELCEGKMTYKCEELSHTSARQCA